MGLSMLDIKDGKMCQDIKAMGSLFLPNHYRSGEQMNQCHIPVILNESGLYLEYTCI